MVMVVRSTWAVPVVFVEQPPDIMLPIGMSTVKFMSSASMAPERVPGMPFCMPEKVTDPVTLTPCSASCQLIVPSPRWPIMLPGEPAVVESEAVPTQVPPTDAAVIAVGAGAMELPPHAATKSALVTNADANVCRISLLMNDATIQAACQSSHPALLADVRSADEPQCLLLQ